MTVWPGLKFWIVPLVVACSTVKLVVVRLREGELTVTAVLSRSAPRQFWRTGVTV